MDDPQYITMTQAKLASLKAHYKKALEEDRETFVFEGREILTDYAKYMIEYLEHGPFSGT